MQGPPDIRTIIKNPFFLLNRLYDRSELEALMEKKTNGKAATPEFRAPLNLEYKVSMSDSVFLLLAFQMTVPLSGAEGTYLL